jgi:hypothetical protein
MSALTLRGVLGDTSWSTQIDRLASSLPRQMSSRQRPRSRVVHLEPLGWIGGPIVLLNPRRLKIQRPTHPLQVMGEGFDSTCIAPSFRGALLVRLVIERTIVISFPHHPAPPAHQKTTDATAPRHGATLPCFGSWAKRPSGLGNTS